jgi:hypothetical protein
MRAPGQDRIQHEIDHLLEITHPQRRPTRADSPQVELMGLSHVRAVDRVAPVDHSRTGEHYVRRRPCREAIKGGGHQRRRVRPQDQITRQVARVASIPGHGLGRIEEPVVVVLDGDNRVGPVSLQRDGPGAPKGRLDLLDDPL